MKKNEITIGGVYACGLLGVDHQPRTRAASIDVVPEDRHTASPFALALLGGDLVANTLTDDLAFELGE